MTRISLAKNIEIAVSERLTVGWTGSESGRGVTPNILTEGSVGGAGYGRGNASGGYSHGHGLAHGIAEGEGHEDGHCDLWNESGPGICEYA